MRQEDYQETHSHGELVVGKQLRHEVEKVLVILSQHNRFESHLPEDWFETRREFPFGRPRF
jgi:hypothetical protein